jgi:hypothetical protein
MTNNRLEGVVETRILGREFEYYLKVMVPALENYTTTIVQIRHSIEEYPVYVTEVTGGTADRFVTASNEA